MANSTHNIRKELASSGQDPFQIAALALAHNERLHERIKRLEKRLAQAAKS